MVGRGYACLCLSMSVFIPCVSKSVLLTGGRVVVMMMVGEHLEASREVFDVEISSLVGIEKGQGSKNPPFFATSVVWSGMWLPDNQNTVKL